MFGGDLLVACFTNHGFLVDTQPMGQGTPFANVLFRLTARAR
jgi:hypothetical protein